MKSVSISEIAERINGTILGNNKLLITGPEEIAQANETQITFIGSKKYIKAWEESKACAGCVNEDLDIQPGEGKALIKVKNADLAMAEILAIFMPDKVVFETEIHPSAFIHSSASIGENTKIGAGAYIGKGVIIGSNCTIYPNVSIFDDSKIGNHTEIWSGTVVRERTEIGHQCIIHPNVTIGADGFGFRPAPDGRGLQKIPHIGNVVIGNAVEIGAGTCIDRGKFSATIIGDGCKLDNLIQIGHNVKLGRSCVLAAAIAVGGSVKMGDGCLLGGAAQIADHITLGNRVTVGGNAAIINDWPDGAKIMGFPAVEAREALKQWVYMRKIGKSTTPL